MTHEAKINNTQAKIIIKKMKEFLGNDQFEHNIPEALRDHLHTWEDLYSSKVMTFLDKEGEPFDTVIAKIDNINEIVEKLITVNDYKQPLVVTGADGGQNKIITTLSIFDLSNLEGGHVTIISSAADYVSESRYNVELMLKDLSLSDVKYDLNFVVDLKLANVITGKYSYQFLICLLKISQKLPIFYFLRLPIPFGG